MRYGIISNGRVTEPTDIPPGGVGDPVAWCNKYRWIASWVSVSDDAVPGATYNSPGSSTNPPDPPAPAPAPVPLKLRPDEILNLLPATVVKSIEESTVASIIKRKVVFKGRPPQTKDQGIALFNDIEGAGLMNNAQNAAAVAAWPEA